MIRPVDGKEKDVIWDNCQGVAQGYRNDVAWVEYSVEIGPP